MLTLRYAQRDDAAALAAIAERTFRDTFSAITPAEDMDLHCRTTYTTAIQAAEIANPELVTWLAEDDGTLAGFAQWRRSHPHRCVVGERPSELNRIYCLREWHGRGVAGLLMREVLGRAAASASDCVWLGVWEQNARAIAFYGKFGFVEVGEHIFQVGRDMQRDLIMSRPITGAARHSGWQS